MTLHSTNTAQPSAQRGAVFVTMMLLVMMLVMLSLSLIETTADVSTRSESHTEEVRLRAVADAATDLSMHHLWNRYKSYLGSSGETSLSSFRTFLDWLGVNAWEAGEEESGEFHIFGDMTYNEAGWVNLHADSGLPLGASKSPSLDGVHVHRMDVMREDATQSTALRVRAEVSFGSDARTSRFVSTERVYFAGGERFSGFDYALLANNVNCIMCHATIDSVARYYNTDPALRGSFTRVRAGTMESLKIRVGKADSQVAGAFYTRGPVMAKDGTLLATLAGTSLDSAVFNADHELVEDASGNLTSTGFVNASGAPLPEGENLYLNYPVDVEKQTDGAMPEEFPPVIPDSNGNRLVDDDEFVDAADGAEGRITGGTKVLVSAGRAYESSGLPFSDSTATVAGMVSGHTVLVGTQANPLVIDGRVAVRGDVILGGVIKGSGTIIAKNNLYILGSVTYADGVDASGNRTFGTGVAGGENRLTLAAGGNVLVGNFLESKDGTKIDGTSAGAFSFTMSEITLFNQMEWTKTQAALPDATGTSIANPLYDPEYTPRFYTIYDSNQVAIFNKGTATVDSKGAVKVSGTYFNAPTQTWLGKEHLSSWDPLLLSMVDQSDASMAGASFVSLMPRDGWIDAAQLSTMWAAMEASHAGGPLEIDAFLYTNNSIMLLTRKVSAYKGRALINGGLVAADLGVLVPGIGNVGLQLNYDDRHKDVLKLRESTLGELELKRGPRLR